MDEVCITEQQKAVRSFFEFLCLLSMCPVSVRDISQVLMRYCLLIIQALDHMGRLPIAASRPNEVVHIDFITLQPADTGAKQICVLYTQRYVTSDQVERSSSISHDLNVVVWILSIVRVVGMMIQIVRSNTNEQHGLTL